MTKRSQLCLVEDTTGSMYPCFDRVRRRASDLVMALKREDPGIEVAVVAHGDYCDGARMIQRLDFTDNLDRILAFLHDVKRTDGGDSEECYEYALHDMGKLSWATAGDVVRMGVLFGDEVPHHPREILRWPMYASTGPLDWRQEVRELAARQVRLYGVQCLNRRHATPFWRELSESSGGFHLELDQFETATEFIMASFLRGQDDGQQRVKSYADTLQSQGRMNRNMATQFGRMSGDTYRPASTYTAGTGRLVPVEPGRFQVMRVDSGTPIRKFVEDAGIPYRIGRGFYELDGHRKEEIQERKEVVVQDRATGDFFQGEAARELLELPVGVRGKLKPPAHVLAKYRIFVQSTSVNRELRAGALFLYEVDRGR